MTKYIIRLDDASEYMDIDKWTRMETLLNKYGIKPLFGIIPCNKDKHIVPLYESDPGFWDRVQGWIAAGWTPALHGYTHEYSSKEGGINPVNRFSEFAGVPYEQQAEKLKNGYAVLAEHGVKANVFFAPAHTFDENTLKAIKEETPIRIISDTVATDVYKYNGLYFVPLQCGALRKLPMRTVTGCYHPNTMNDAAFEKLEGFIRENGGSFISFDAVEMKDRRLSLADKAFRRLYFARRR